jgi:hypothetical protein
MRQKVYSWIRRYLPAEIWGTIGTLLPGIVIYSYTHNLLLTALISTIGENVGYYGYIIHKEYKNRKPYEHSHLKFALTLTRNLILEFGPGEYFDLFILRPAAMYYFPLFLGDLTLGLIVGKFAADAVFYAIIITSYELRKVIFKEK